jgi:hypothetical protein
MNHFILYEGLFKLNLGLGGCLGDCHGGWHGATEHTRVWAHHVHGGGHTAADATETGAAGGALGGLASLASLRLGGRTEVHLLATSLLVELGTALALVDGTRDTGELAGTHLGHASGGSDRLGATEHGLAQRPAEGGTSSHADALRDGTEGGVCSGLGHGGAEVHLRALGNVVLAALGTLVHDALDTLDGAGTHLGAALLGDTGAGRSLGATLGGLVGLRGETEKSLELRFVQHVVLLLSVKKLILGNYL